MTKSVSHWGLTEALLHGGGVETAKDDTRKVYRALSAEENFQIQSFKDIGQEFIDLIDTLPLSRELALAKTKVEEAVMWAVKGVSK